MLQVYKEKEESGELVSLSSSPRGNSGGAEMKRVIEKIFRVMYAAVEDNVVVDDEGNVSENNVCIIVGFLSFVVCVFLVRHYCVMLCVLIRRCSHIVCFCLCHLTDCKSKACGRCYHG